MNEKVRPEHLGEDPEAAFAEYVHEKIHLLKRRMASDKVENITGFLLKAIKENYANPEFAEAQKRQVMEEQKKIRQQRQPEIKALIRQQETLKNARDEAIGQRCKALVEESPELIAALEHHATRCESCRMELNIWREISAAALTMHSRPL